MAPNTAGSVGHVGRRGVEDGRVGCARAAAVATPTSAAAQIARPTRASRRRPPSGSTAAPSVSATRGRQQVRAAHALRVALRRSWRGRRRSASTGCASAAQAVARDVLGAHLGQAEDAPAAAADARGELGVLVVVPVLVPAALRLEHRARPDAGEAAVDLDLAVRGLPELRPAAAERRVERQRDPARPGALAARELRAADVRRAAAAQALDAAREVVLGVVGVRVHARDVGAAGGREADVEARSAWRGAGSRGCARAGRAPAARAGSRRCGPRRRRR